METEARQFWLVRATSRHSNLATYAVMDYPANETIAATRVAGDYHDGWSDHDVIRVAPIKAPEPGAWEVFDVVNRVERRERS
jgi:hypothetical protein